MDYLRDKSSIVSNDAPYGAAKELVYELDRHLAAHSLLHHQYLKHAWLVPDAATKTLLQEQSDDALTHLRTLAENIVWLGGIPISSPCEHENLSYLEFEREGLYRASAMLDKDRNDEETVLFRLSITVETAKELAVPRTEAVLRAAYGAAQARGKRLREVTPL